MTDKWLLLTVVWLAAACNGEGDDTDTDATDTTQTQDELATWEDVRPILAERCARCHSANRLSTYRRLETHQEVTELRTNILDKLRVEPPRGLRMPVASNHVDPDGCTPDHPQLNDMRLTDAELDMLTEFLERTDHSDYVDTTAPIEPPVVPVLADSIEYVSSQYDVLNDGFVTPPDGASDDFMHEHGYDERDYDQMEDDWFCIRFDPNRTDPGFITGVQVGTQNGQIFLNSQLLIDTNDGFAAAQLAAEERGSDWYRCDDGIGFNEAIPLWRTPPGGGPTELPESTGLRFEPGWTFVMRVDFHTHFDAEEFNRLDQNGVIDRDAGTMTWFDQASLRASWADSVQRELQWLSVGPSTPQQRQAFEVPRGESVRTYTATLPEDGDYAVFSTEVSMGKHGRTATLVDTTSGACVANNSDFSPKWIGHATYGEADAPSLTGNSELELTCSYRNADEAVGWGAESQAAVWGHRERCSGVLFYYER